MTTDWLLYSVLLLWRQQSVTNQNKRISFYINSNVFIFHSAWETKSHLTHIEVKPSVSIAICYRVVLWSTWYSKRSNVTDLLGKRWRYKLKTSLLYIRITTKKELFPYILDLSSSRPKNIKFSSTFCDLIFAKIVS